MRTAILIATAAAAVLPATPALAQRHPDREYGREVREAQRDYNRDIRRADSRRDVVRAQRDYRRDIRDAQRDRARDWRQYNRWDHNRFEPGQRAYFADRYYRAGPGYAERRLGRNDRIYRGGNGQYYCRHNDGTTGLLVGGVAGGVLGNVLTNGSSGLLGTLLGAGGGALLGRQIDRGGVRCR